VRVRRGDLRALGHDEITPSGGRRQHAVVSELVGAWRGNECGEPLDERQRVKGHGGRAVTPVPLEAVDDSAVGCELA
jgi:hypothetical protein